MSRQDDLDELRRRLSEERWEMQKALDRLKDRLECLEKREPFRKFVSKDGLMPGDRILTYEGDGCYVVLRDPHYAIKESGAPPRESNPEV